MKVIICRGLPGSGRTEWSKEYVKSNKAIRVCRSDMRKMSGHEYCMEMELALAEAENAIISYCDHQDIDVVVDGNNLNKNVITSIRGVFESHAGGCFDAVSNGFIEIKDFPISLEDALEYDNSSGRDPLGESKIRKLHKLHEELMND